MCFSAEASFAVGGALIPAGAYCLWSAAVKKPSYLGLAAVPLVFGIQQLGEGFVWLGLHAEDPVQIRTASLFFLFFALAFWPFWFPFTATLMERERRRKILFGALTVLASAWFWFLFLPLAFGPASMLTTDADHHSIAYHYSEVPLIQAGNKLVLRALYFGCVALPMVLGSENLGRIPGLVLGGSAVFAAIVYHYAFVSVWCFFAAVLAGYLCWIFYQLPATEKVETKTLDAVVPASSSNSR